MANGHGQVNLQMTRINLVPPSELRARHLAAEHYELPGVFRLVYGRQLKGYTPSNCDIPPTYRLGKGHQMFFYDKLGFLTSRHIALTVEMRHRGYSASYDLPPVATMILPHWFGDYVPTPEAIALSRERINQRIVELGWDLVDIA